MLLQHPRERDVPIGTARMASLCLPNSELHVGVHSASSPALARALGDPARPAALLYPGAGRDRRRGESAARAGDAASSSTAPGRRPRRSCATTPSSRALPRYAFTPPSPSEYRIRREPRRDVRLDHRGARPRARRARRRSRALPRAARSVPRDGRRAARVRERLHRGARRRKRRRARAPRARRAFRDRSRSDLVCVVGEANAWPYRSAERGDGHPDELVHWVALRPSTGETFDVHRAPRHPLAPSTPRTCASPRTSSRPAARSRRLPERFAAFVRERDVVCSWGRYATAPLRELGRRLCRARGSICARRRARS